MIEFKYTKYSKTRENTFLLYFFGGVYLNFVEPLRLKSEIEQMKVLLKRKSFRDYLLFVIGINTGMSFKELLNLKFSEIILNHSVNDSIIKNGKEYPVNTNLKKEINFYFQSLKSKVIENRYVFENKEFGKPINRSHAYRVLNDAAKLAGIPAKIGTHTLRKTYGYHYYSQNHNLKVLQKLFNHSSKDFTLKYIGVFFDKSNNEDFDFYL